MYWVLVLGANSSKPQYIQVLDDGNYIKVDNLQKSTVFSCRKDANTYKLINNIKATAKECKYLQGYLCIIDIV